MSDESLVCDFCGGEPIWVYPMLHTNEVVMMNSMPIGDLDRDWLVCDSCSGYIETDDSMGLQNVTLISWKHHIGSINKLPGDWVERRQKLIIEAVHRVFYSRRNGARYLLRNT